VNQSKNHINPQGIAAKLRDSNLICPNGATSFSPAVARNELPWVNQIGILEQLRGQGKANDHPTERHHSASGLRRQQNNAPQNHDFLFRGEERRDQYHQSLSSPGDNIA
jgi:hypothetical protein